MDLLTYDRNIVKSIALVAEPGYINPRYINLAEADQDMEDANYFQLRQMHTLASGIIDGQVTNPTPGFAAEEWLNYGLKHSKEHAKKS